MNWYRQWSERHLGVAGCAGWSDFAGRCLHALLIARPTDFPHGDALTLRLQQSLERFGTVAETTAAEQRALYKAFRKCYSNISPSAETVWPDGTPRQMDRSSERNSAESDLCGWMMIHLADLGAEEAAVLRLFMDDGPTGRDGWPDPRAMWCCWLLFEHQFGHDNPWDPVLALRRRGVTLIRGGVHSTSFAAFVPAVWAHP